MWLVVGLGNPGEEYAQSRHNVGFIVLDELVGKEKWERSDGVEALYTWTKLGKQKVELLKPQTFMNKSGSAVLYAKKKHKVKSENIIVVHDDMDLPFGSIKIVQGRGAGGHRGVVSIIRALGTKNFIRVRVGVVPTTSTGKLKKPKSEQKVLDFLMGAFTTKEHKALSSIKKKAASAIEVIITDGVEKAMNQHN